MADVAGYSGRTRLISPNCSFVMWWSILIWMGKSESEFPKRLLSEQSKEIIKSGFSAGFLVINSLPFMKRYFDGNPSSSTRQAVLPALINSSPIPIIDPIASPSGRMCEMINGMPVQFTMPCSDTSLVKGPATEENGWNEYILMTGHL